MPTIYCTFLLWLLAGALAAQPAPAHYPPAGAALPARLVRLLAPPLDYPHQDIARLRAARAQWAGDSLGRLLVYNRFGADFYLLQQPDSIRRYLYLAWRQAGPAQRRQQPAEVVELANGLANYYHTRDSYDSALVYYRHAIAAFRQARLDSSRGAPPGAQLRATHQPWTGGHSLASSVANAGSALRQSGHLRQALRYYERAQALYEFQHNLPGAIWTQSLVGEAYAEQGSVAQALRIIRIHRAQDPESGAHILAEFVLDYYAPLLLAAPGRQSQAIQAAYPKSELRTLFY